MFLPSTLIFIALALGCRADSAGHPFRTAEFWQTVTFENVLANAPTRFPGVEGNLALKLNSWGVQSFGHAYYPKQGKICARFADDFGLVSDECAGFQVLASTWKKFGLVALPQWWTPGLFHLEQEFIDFDNKRAVVIDIGSEKIFGWVNVRTLTARGVDSNGTGHMFQGREDIIKHCRFIRAI